jgi:hypothetical protein
MRSPFSAIARPIAAYLGSSGPSRPTPSRWNKYRPEIAPARINSRAYRRRKDKLLQNICRKVASIPSAIAEGRPLATALLNRWEHVKATLACFLLTSRKFQWINEHPVIR